MIIFMVKYSNFSDQNQLVLWCTS